MDKITGKHTDRYVSADSCRHHGIGVGVCRVCLKNSQVGDAQRKAKHIAGYSENGYYVSEGFPRMARL